MSRNPDSRWLPLVKRGARMAFTFVMLNVSAVIGVLVAMTRRKVWR
jgi:hypothetical protein